MQPIFVYEANTCTKTSSDNDALIGWLNTVEVAMKNQAAALEDRET
jgi:hypothetical protein